MAQIEFFFDIGSPYSYMAATQMEALAARTSTPVRWRPFLLGAVFKATGGHSPAENPAKARYMLRDLARWSAQFGVPFQFPSRFPLKTLLPQRALVAAERVAGAAAVPPFALALFEGYWNANRDVSDPVEVMSIAAGVGLESGLAEASTEQETKDALRATTEEAIERGAFGAPAIFVGDELFWGCDRLHQVEAHLASLRAEG